MSSSHPSDVHPPLALDAGLRRLLATLGAGLCLAGCGGTELEALDESVSDQVEPIIGGSSVALPSRRELGLVDVGWSSNIGSTGCSGAIVNSRWVLTAAHCVTAAPQPLDTFVARVPRTDGGFDSRPVRATIQLGTNDIMMLELDASVPSTWPSTTRTTTTSSNSSLVGKTVTCYGRGHSAYASNGSTTNFGNWRKLDRVVTSSDSNHLFIEADDGGGNIVATGDDGGPCLYNGQFVGVIKSITRNCSERCFNEFATITAAKPNAAAFSQLADGFRRPIMRALNNNFALAYPGVTFSYKDWDNVNHCARLHGGVFAIAPNCDWMKGGAGTGALVRATYTLKYKTWDGSNWNATTNGLTLLEHWAQGATTSHSDVGLNYKNWSNENWSGRLPSLLYIGPKNDLGVLRGELHIGYRNWDNAKWCASLHGTRFMLAANCDWANGRVINVIEYKNWSGADWSATVSNGLFTHKPRLPPVVTHTSENMDYTASDNSDWRAYIAR